MTSRSVTTISAWCKVRTSASPTPRHHFVGRSNCSKPLLDMQPDDAKTLSDMGSIYNNIGLLLDRQKRHADAETAFQKAISLQRKAFDAAPDVARYRELLQNHYANYVKSLRSHEKRHEAAKLLQERDNLLAGSR